MCLLVAVCSQGLFKYLKVPTTKDGLPNPWDATQVAKKRRRYQVLSATLKAKNGKAAMVISSLTLTLELAVLIGAHLPTPTLENQIRE